MDARPLFVLDKTDTANSTYGTANETTTLSFGRGKGTTIRTSPKGITGESRNYEDFRTVIGPINDGILTISQFRRNMSAADFLNPPPLTMGYAAIRFGDPERANTTSSIVRAEQCTLIPCLRTYKIQAKKGLPETVVQAINHGVILEASVPSTLCWQPDKHQPNYNSSFAYGITHEPFMLWSGQNSAFCPVAEYGSTISYRLSASEQWTFGRQYISSTDVLDVVPTHNLTYLFNNIAASLTNLALSLNNQTVTGTARSSEVDVSVRWAWLIFPVLVEGLGFVLFIMTVTRAHRARVALWRTSLLPLLYRGPGESAKAAEVTGDRLCGMEMAPRKAVVRLASLDDGNGDRLRVVASVRDR